eukprot:Stramenopile-MAST_4_protein_6820
MLSPKEQTLTVLRKTPTKPIDVVLPQKRLEYEKVAPAPPPAWRPHRANDLKAMETTNFLITPEIGRLERCMGKGPCVMWMGLRTPVDGKTIAAMDLEYQNTRTVMFMKAIGKTTNFMEEEP